MNDKIFRDPIMSISVSIIVGAIIIAGSILWAGGHFSPGITTNNNGVVTAPSQPTNPTVDGSKVKTAGEPFVGNPNAKITLAYWFDYQCPFCKQNEQSVIPSIVSDYVNSGKVKIVFKDFAFLGPDSTTLAINERAVWDVDQSKFYAWHKAIFDNQGQEGSGWASTQTKIDAITTQVLGATETARVDGLVISKANIYTAEINADKTEGAAFGVTGTPSIVVGKQLIVGAEPYSNIKSAIDAALGL